MNIYLAGGMHSDWRDKITNTFWRRCNFFDPMKHSLKEEKQYTELDLEAIKNSDMVIAYMDNENPSGYGMNLEVGYARALGKTIIFVDDLTDDRKKYFGMLRSCSNIIVKDMFEIIRILDEFLKLKENYEC